ncbi:MAG: hypothetical protein ABW250_24870 [Pyrinomonadaceae bacterium]
MSASEEQKIETPGAADEVEAREPGGQPADGVHQVPLFLRGGSDGRKGDAQDEKDEAAE